MFKNKRLQLSYSDLTLITDFLYDKAYELEHRKVGNMTIEEACYILKRAHQIYDLREKLLKEVEII